MTYSDFEALRGKLDKARFIDGSDLFWTLRIPKSPAEVALMRKACDITAKALADLHAATTAGMSERELHAVMTAAVMKHGADRPGSMPLASRTPGEFHQADSHLRLHTRRTVRDGDLIWLDAGSIVGGYWSDTFRMYSLGKASQELRDAYATVYECVEAAIAATRPGAPTRDRRRPTPASSTAPGYSEFAAGRFRQGSAVARHRPRSHRAALHEPDRHQHPRAGHAVLTLEPFIYRRTSASS